MALPVYSSLDVQVSWNGVPLDGLAPDSFVVFSRNTDLTDEEVGASGDLSISILPDKTGTCTISLQQNSRSNLILSGALLAQEQSGTLIRGALSIADPSGSVLALLTGAHLKKSPEVGLGSSASGKTRDWVFFCEFMQFTSAPSGLATAVSQSAQVAGALGGLQANGLLA